MKKLFFFSACFLYTTGLLAQPWLDGKTNNGPLNLQKITDAYRQSAASNNADDGDDEHNNDKVVPEKKDYHFGRWQWYWERHTDGEGNLVSPSFALREWYKHYGPSVQSGAKPTANQSAWTFQGPDKSNANGKGIGRIQVVAFHPTDTFTYWIGSAGGGAWKTTNGGLTWTAINDRFPVLGIADIVFNPKNPNTIYLCTGDRDAADNSSVGILKSTDGGTTWDTTGFNWKSSDISYTTSLLINPIDTNSLTLSTSLGIYKSYDAGATWSLVHGGGYKQVVYNPGDTSIIYATGYSTGSNQVFRSANGGATWSQVTNFPANRRVALAVTKDNPAIVRVIVANSSNGLEGIYNSSDTGKTFIKKFSDGTNCSTNLLASTANGDKCGGQGWYDLTIAISPVDTNKMVIGGVNTWYSSNSGTSWQIANQWTSTLPGIKIVHADKHYHVYHPMMPNTLFECNDGGIFKTTNPIGGIWDDITNGLGITQFYRNAVTDNAPFVIGGAQDNGSKMINNGVYSELTGGDGMDCQINPADKTIFYTSTQYGELRRTVNSGTNFTDISNNIPGGQPTGAWITPFILHPVSPTIILAGYSYLYISMNQGNTWTTASPNFFGNVKRIAVCKTNPDYIYVLVNNAIRISTDFGAKWTTLKLPATATTDATDIQVDPFNPQHLWVTFGGYGPNKVAEYTPQDDWKIKDENLPNIPINCIEIDSAIGTLYLGTDFGVYYRDVTMNQWEPFNNALPTVEVIDLGINYTSGEIWAATYGRGMWKSPKNSSLENVHITNTIPLQNSTITVFPNPNYGKFELRTENSALHGANVSVRIINVNGAVALQKNITINNSGVASVDSDLPKGTYIVELSKGSMTLAKTKMVVY